MKKIAYIMTCISLLLFVGCAGVTPESTVKNYLEDVKTGRYKEAIKLFYFEGESPENEEINELAAKMDENTNEQGGIVEYEILSEEVNEAKTQAQVIAKVLYGDGMEENMNFTLVKVDKKWLISPMEK